MIKIGLTGGIGSGKSTVLSMLMAANIKAIDADLVSKQVLKLYPKILDDVRKEFGYGYFDWRGEFRRKEFGNHIFRFPKLRVKYEEIIMPYIKKEIFDAFKRYEDKDEKIVVLDAPTLIENKLNEDMDYVIVVDVDTNIQIQRIIARDKISRGEAVNRINSQMNIEEKKRYADIIISNNSDLNSTKLQVEDLIKFIKKLK